MVIAERAKTKSSRSFHAPYTLVQSIAKSMPCPLSWHRILASAITTSGCPCHDREGDDQWSLTAPNAAVAESLRKLGLVTVPLITDGNVWLRLELANRFISLAYHPRNLWECDRILHLPISRLDKRSALLMPCARCTERYDQYCLMPQPYIWARQLAKSLVFSWIMWSASVQSPADGRATGYPWTASPGNTLHGAGHEATQAIQIPFNAALSLRPLHIATLKTSHDRGIYDGRNMRSCTVHPSTTDTHWQRRAASPWRYRTVRSR